MTFSKEEQKVLKLLLNSNELKKEGMILLDVFLENEFFSNNHNVSILVDPPVQNTLLSIDSKSQDECRKEIITITILIQLLIKIESKGLVSYVGSKNTKKISLGNQHSNGTTLTLVQSLSDFINIKLGNFILPSEALKELVKNNFKSEEQIRHKQTMWLAGIALTTSICFGLWGILKDLCT